MLRKWLDFFVFTSLYIALCAVLMTWQTTLLFGWSPSFLFILFVIGGTACSYNFHWYLTPPDTGQATYKTSWNITNRKIHLWLFLAGLLLAAITGFLLMEHWPWLIVTAVVTFLYSAPKIPWGPFAFLRKIAVAKTVFLALVWTQVTVILPMVIHNPYLTTPQEIFAVNRFFFIYAICILFDYRDRERDLKENIRSMVTQISDAGVDRLFAGSMVVFFATLLMPGAGWNAWYMVLLGLPGIVLLLLYSYAKRSRSDYLYYFVLDGLMMLSAPMVILAKFVG